MIKKLHHVAVAVESVQEALRFYYDVLGLTEITIKTLKDRGLKVALIRAGDSEIELLEPTSPDNTVRRFLERRGSGLHHICFEVDDIEASMRELEGRGGEFIEPVPREGAVGLVSFMPPSVADGVLVEFAQIAAPPVPPVTTGLATPSSGAVTEQAKPRDVGEPDPPAPPTTTSDASTPPTDATTTPAPPVSTLVPSVAPPPSPSS